MQQLSFSPVTPPEAVLARYEICRTQNLEEARQWGERIFCENDLYSLDSKGSVNTRIFYRKVGGIGIPTIKPWNKEFVFEKLDYVEQADVFAVAMDVDGAGLPFLKAMNPNAGSKSVSEM